LEYDCFFKTAVSCMLVNDRSVSMLTYLFSKSNNAIDFLASKIMEYY
jgi:hypothetical protein